MPTPRKTSPGRANAEKARTTPRAGRVRAFKFGKRMDAKGISRTGSKPAAKPAAPARKPNRFEGAMQTGAAARKRGYGYLSAK